MKVVIAVAVFMVVTLGGAAGAWYLWGGQLLTMVGLGEQAAMTEPADEAAVAAAPQPDPVYLSLDPPFLVNFEMNGSLRFLQVSIEVMASDEAAIEALRTHMAHVRNNILLILGDQTLATLMSTDAKEALRETLLKEVRFVLTQRTGNPGIDALYFTNFVMQ